VGASISELDARPQNQRRDRAGHKRFVRTSTLSDSCRHMDSDAADVITAHLDLAGVQAGAQWEADLRR
jgi:hypothetical protein